MLLDRLDGQIADLVHRQATLTRTEQDTRVRQELDGYTNLFNRAAKNRREGRHDLARLEEIEAAPWLLWTLFAWYGRVRPYNKYLRWELDTYPRIDAMESADYLITALIERPSALFPDLEVSRRSSSSARPAGTISASRRPWSVRHTIWPKRAASRGDR